MSSSNHCFPAQQRLHQHRLQLQQQQQQQQQANQQQVSNHQLQQLLLSQQVNTYISQLIKVLLRQLVGKIKGQSTCQ